MEYDDGLSDSFESSSSKDSKILSDSFESSSSKDSKISSSRKEVNMKNEGLSKTLLLQLLQDIEQRGGLHNVSLKRICGRNPEFYGIPGSQLQRQIQNRVSRWQKLTPSEYDLVLIHFQVKRFGEEKGPKPSSASIPISQSEMPTPGRVFNTPQKMMSGKVSNCIDNVADRRYVGKHMCAKYSLRCFILVCLLTIHISPNFSVNIVVDIIHPERNREVVVFHFKDKVDKGILHNGFSVEIELDFRDFMQGACSAQLISGSEIMIKVPGQTANYAHDFALVADAEAKANRKCENLHQARSVTRNAIKEDQDRSVKHIILSFPTDMALANTIYSPDLPTGMIKMDIVTTAAQIPLPNGATFDYHIHRAVWKVHIMEEVDRKV